MAWLKRSSPSAILALAVTLGLAITATAQEILPLRAPSLSSMLPNKWELTPSPQGSGNPTNRQAGATRGACARSERDLTALVPKSGVGSTIAEYPTLYWYMPKISTEGYKPELEFTLKDQSQQTVYFNRYALGESKDGVVVGTPGIKSLPIFAFANLPTLEIDKEYRWELSIICNPLDTAYYDDESGKIKYDQSGNSYVTGKIKRVKLDPELVSKLQQANLQERIALYADNRFWYETVGAMVQLRRDRPDDKNLAEAWNKLISSVDLLRENNVEEPWFQEQDTITNRSR